MIRTWINGFKTLHNFSSSFLSTTRCFGTFADPTYDSTFKMLFANSKNLDILTSLINSLLDFKGGQKVEKVDLLQETFVPTSSFHISTLIDVRCRTNSGEEIIVEMQRHAKSYFLPRTQFHMAKAISAHISDGEAKKHHEIIPRTYVLAISKEGLFTKKYLLNNEDLYETTVVPTIIELGTEVPENKMYWKFYELNKFMKLFKEGKISSDTAVKLSIKDQWLHFLHECSKQESVPDGIDDIIKKAYSIMEQSNWTRENILALEMSVLTEQEELEELELRFSEGKAQGKAQGLLEGKAQGILEGKAKGILEGEIKTKIETAKNLLKTHKVTTENIAEIVGLSLESVQRIADNQSQEVLSELLQPFEIGNNSDIHLSGENSTIDDQTL